MEFTLSQIKALHVLNTINNVFLTGAAGTGKSFLLRHYLRNTSAKKVPILASTGAAAVIIEGRTVHSFFGLGILEGGKDATVARALQRKSLLSRLQLAETIVIDEVSMLSGETLAAAEEIARGARNSQEPWGGLRIIAVGDFAQLPPVQPNGEECKDWAFTHAVWQQSNFQSAYLQEVVRTQEPRLLQVLNNVRIGNATAEVVEFLEERQQAGSDTFDGTHLFPHKRSVEAYNMQRLHALDGEIRVFPTKYKGGAHYIEVLQKQCPIPLELSLKIGALVMMRKNDMIYPYQYVNGSLGTVLEMTSETLTVQLLTGNTIDVHKEEFTYLDGNGSKKATAINFPITLAWATTIHKAQGATIDKLMVDMGGLWEPGHAYVALSRASSETGLCVCNWNGSGIFMDPAVQKFYEEVSAQWNALSPDLATTITMPTKQEVQAENRKRIIQMVEKEYSIDHIASVLHITDAVTRQKLEEFVAKQQELLQSVEEEEPLEYSESVFQELRQWRMSEAKVQGIAPFMVFHDSTLQELAYYLPQTEEDCLKISGISDGKFEKYGQELLAMFASAITIHSLEPKPILKKRRTKSKSKKIPNHLRTLQLYQDGKSIAEIALELDFTEGTIVTHLQKLLDAGEVLDLDRIAPSATIFEPIQAQLQTLGTDALSPVFAALKGKYSYDDIKLVRLCMLSRALASK